MTPHSIFLAAATAPEQSPLMMPMMLVLMFAMFYLLIIRPQQRREKERQAMLAALKNGDRVVFAGGLLGIVTNVKDKTCTVRLADNVKVEALRSAISQVLTKDDTPDETASK